MTGKEPAPKNEPEPTPAPAPQPAPQPEPEPAPEPTPAPAPTPTPANEPTPAPAGKTVNAHKYERDMQKLQEQIEAKDEELEGYKGVKAELDQWKAELEAEKVESALKGAGCIDTVAAAARLKEFDGDVSKLKEEAPYLFKSSDSSKSTGGNPKGAPDPEDERTKRMRETFGLTNE